MHKAQWLDGLPSSWSAAPAWSVFKDRGERSATDAVHLTPSQSYGVLPQAEYMEITGNRVVLNLTGQDTMKAVRKGDFIIHLRSFQGGLEGSSLDGKVSTAYTVLKPAGDLNNSYYQFLLKSKAFVDELANLTFQLRDGQTVNYARFARMALPVPPLHTQQRIADYLDRETGEIDAMIAKMDQLAEQLEARRKTLVVSATQQGGLALEATDGTTAILPNGWRLLPLKFAVDDAQTGVWGDEPNGGDDDVLCARVADFDRRKINVTDVPTVRRVSEKDREKCSLERGDILIEKSGGTDRNPVGTVVAYEGETPAVYANFIFRIRPTKEHDSRFWLYALHGSYLGGRTWNYVRQTTGIQNLDVNGFLSMVHAVPNLDEQQRIADHLDLVTSRIDKMLAKVAELKSLLTERRAALITEVVTGRKEVA